MKEENKRIIIRVVLISLLILLVELISGVPVIGFFYKIILAFIGLQYIKQNNLFGAKVVILMFLLPIFINTFFLYNFF